MQLAGQFRHFPVLALFLDEGVQARVAVRVQQPQAREVALHAQLFRRGGEQQQAGAGARQPLDALIGFRRRVLGPLQVVGFIHHHRVPLGGGQGVDVAAFQEGGAAQNQLLGQEGVVHHFRRVRLAQLLGDQVGEHVLDAFRAGFAQGFQALFVEDRETQVEAPRHLHEPLVHQGVRHHDQHPAGAAGLQLLMENQTRFDGLAQAHFVGQQHPGRVAPRHLVGDVQLVADQVDARAAQALDLGAFALGAGAQRRQPQLEPAVRRQLIGEQTVHGAAEAQLMAQQGFRHRLHIVRLAGGVGVVHHQPVVILGALHHQLQAVAGGQGIALVEGDA